MRDLEALITIAPVPKLGDCQVFLRPFREQELSIGLIFAAVLTFPEHPELTGVRRFRRSR